MLHLTYQVTASLFSLWPGSAPAATQPFALTIGMGRTQAGLLALAAAQNHWMQFAAAPAGAAARLFTYWETAARGIS
jgi:hypothetical protein